MVSSCHALVCTLLAVATLFDESLGFIPTRPTRPFGRQALHGAETIVTQQRRRPRCQLPTTSARKSPTALNVLLDVPEGFFTVTFPLLGILLSISKSFSRVRMEERAWEQRLEEGRRARLQNDPSLTEMDLRRIEAEQEWSAYGKPRMDEEKERLEREKRGQGRRRVKVMDADDDFDDNQDEIDTRKYHMTDDEIQAFEVQYGVDYDPYYDDPYSEEELPEGKFDVDKKYGDRIYENGEIFYRDAESGLFYRQGAKPRNLSFWN